MTSELTPDADADAAASRGARRLSRGVVATWWYTISAVVFLEAMVVLVFVMSLVAAGVARPASLTVGLGGLAWVASTAPLLFAYRHRTDGAPLARWRRVLAPLVVAAAFGIVAVLVTGVWLIALLPLVQSLVLLNWPSGVRLRVVIAVTLVLVVVGVVDARAADPVSAETVDAMNRWFLTAFSALLPAMTVMSLWWWDVLMALDRARASEARLAATQERLRVATDVHDLQGHHLQVIALQLELAERLMDRDPTAALAQLRASRLSVDEARQGTRDLAMRFRSVPLRVEIANAVDLVRAAGITTESSVDHEADRAPADVLGPVIRETTTNVLRHGGGKWARLSLHRTGSSWRYEISNDVPVDATPSVDGAGLEGLRRRAAEADGSLDARREGGQHSVVVTVPTDLVRTA